MTDLKSAPDPYVLDVTGADIPGEAIRLRDRGPVVAVVLPGDVRAWAVTSPDALKKVFTSPWISKDAHQHWPAFKAGKIPLDWPLTTWVAVRNMFTAYGPEHARLRAAVGPAFTGRAAADLEPQIEQIVTDLLDDLDTRPPGAVVDVRGDYAAQVPLRLINALLGVPSDLTAGLRECVNEIFSTVPQRDPRETSTEMLGLLGELMERRRAEPGEDLTSQLLARRAKDPAGLTEQELLHTLLLVVTAGYETTVNLLDHAIVAILTEGLAADLRRGVIGWKNLIEETLRYAPPVALLPLRYAVEDIEIAGQLIAAGDPVVAAIAAANRHPLAGLGADVFDPHRPKSEHLSFGYGTHFCLGAALARREAAIALTALFDRFPDIALADEGALTPLASFISHGHREVLVHLTHVPVR